MLPNIKHKLNVVCSLCLLRPAVASTPSDSAIRVLLSIRFFSGHFITFLDLFSFRPFRSSLLCVNKHTDNVFPLARFFLFLRKQTAQLVRPADNIHPCERENSLCVLSAPACLFKFVPFTKKGLSSKEKQYSGEGKNMLHDKKKKTQWRRSLCAAHC